MCFPPNDDDADDTQLLPPEYDGPTCIYCGEPLPYGATDYCSALCACYADKDNREDR